MVPLLLRHVIADEGYPPVDTLRSLHNERSVMCLMAQQPVLTWYGTMPIAIIAVAVVRGKEDMREEEERRVIPFCLA